MRKICCIATIVHISLSAFDLAFVGFQNMILNLLQGTLIYSSYLTLRNREIWIYFIVLLGQVVYTLLDVLGIGDGDAAEGTMQHLGQIITLCMTSLMGYFVSSAFYKFRKSGGLHGGLPEG